jgi:hypothetical protein
MIRIFLKRLKKNIVPHEKSDHDNKENVISESSESNPSPVISHDSIEALLIKSFQCIDKEIQQNVQSEENTIIETTVGIMDDNG